MKILGIYFSYNKKFQTQRNYLTTVKKSSKGSQCMDYKDTLIFKTLRIPKIVYLSLIITVPNSLLE